MFFIWYKNYKADFDTLAERMNRRTSTLNSSVDRKCAELCLVLTFLTLLDFPDDCAAASFSLIVVILKPVRCLSMPGICS
jgi:hypothetical protein